jgi:hypothetical protein
VLGAIKLSFRVTTVRLEGAMGGIFLLMLSSIGSSMLLAILEENNHYVETIDHAKSC